MPTFEYDFRYLEAGTQSLEKYLLAADIYWPLGVKAPDGEPPYPLLTLGSMLVSHARLRALPLDPAQGASFRKLENEMYALQTRWSVAWEKKAAREFSARLRLWRDYLEDVRAQPENHVDRYAYEVGRRVMLALLREQAVDIPQAEIDLLGGLDGLLKAVFIPGDFIWGEEYAGSFPRQAYWYLYGRLKGPGEI